ncbi:MAG: hypothetical protein ACYCOU_23505 [Sulfobacillus sp.]
MIIEPFFRVLPPGAQVIHRYFLKAHWQGGEFGGPAGHWIGPGFDTEFTSNLTDQQVVEFYSQAAPKFGFRSDGSYEGTPLNSWSKALSPPCIYGPPCQLGAHVSAGYRGPTPTGVPVVAAYYDFSGS